MEGKYFLNEILTEHGKSKIIDKLQPNVINLIDSDTGSGKTYMIFNHLIHELPDKKRMLYLIDTRAGNNQLVEKNKDAMLYEKLWRLNVNNELPKTQWKLNADGTISYSDGVIDDKIVVMTYHKLAHLFNSNKPLSNNFDLIICDEVHNLYHYQYYFKKGQNNILLFAQFWLDTATNNNDTRILALTATPNGLYKMFPTKIEKVLTEQELQDVKRYETKAKPYLTIDNLITKLPSGKGIIYVQRIGKMKEYAEKARNKYKNLNIEMIWSLNNEQHPMTDEQYAIWQSIFSKEEIPSDIDILFINASCETCINIKSKIDYMIIESWNADTLKQVRGRYRGDLYLCYFPSDKPSYINVPIKYLNVPLFQEEKKALCKEINYRKNGKVIMFPTISQMLLDTGDYTITEGRSQKGKTDREYHMISLVM